MKVVNAPNLSGWSATIIHGGTREYFRYLSVTRPSIAHKPVDVFINGKVLKIVGPVSWEPIEFEVVPAEYDIVKTASAPFTLEFGISGMNYVATGCYVQADSIHHHILKIYTNNVRMF